MMDDQLLGYLLGTLDDNEQRSVETRLSRDAERRQAALGSGRSCRRRRGGPILSRQRAWQSGRAVMWPSVGCRRLRSRPCRGGARCERRSFLISDRGDLARSPKGPQLLVARYIGARSAAVKANRERGRHCDSHPLR